MGGHTKKVKIRRSWSELAASPWCTNGHKRRRGEGKGKGGEERNAGREEKGVRKQ